MKHDPTISRTYKNALKSSVNKNQGARVSLNGKRITIKELGEILGFQPGYTGQLLKSYTPEKLVKRMELKKAKK